MHAFQLHSFIICSSQKDDSQAKKAEEEQEQKNRAVCVCRVRAETVFCGEATATYGRQLFLFSVDRLCIILMLMDIRSTSNMRNARTSTRFNRIVYLS